MTLEIMIMCSNDHERKSFITVRCKSNFVNTDIRSFARIQTATSHSPARRASAQMEDDWHERYH